MRDLKEGALGGGAVVLAATDPANPFGVSLAWPAWCAGEGERRARAHVVIADGELTMLLFGEGAQAMVHLPETNGDGERLARLSGRAVASWMHRRALRIIGHESKGVPLNRSVMARSLTEAGLIPSGPGFRL